MAKLGHISERLASTWTLEITAVILSIASLAALVGTLIAADGRSVLHWQFYEITLNTVVSVLSTISRVAALYVLSAAIGQTKWILFSRGPASLLEFEAIDLASRSVFGCALLLLNARRILFVGAVAVLLALAFDPFAQQLVQLHSEVAYAPNAGVTMPVSSRYDAGSLTFIAATGTANGLAWIDSQADFGMQAAVLSGLTQQKSVIDGQLPLHCGTGNCTWASVQSLAVCSVCNDVTSSLRRWTSHIPAVTFLSHANYPSARTPSTTYSLGEDVFLNNMDGSALDGGSLTMTAYGTGDPKRTTSLKEMDTLVWASGILRAHRNGEQNDTWPTGYTVSATECGLYYCVKDYNVRMTQNQVAETSTELKSAKRSPASWQFLDGFVRSRVNGSVQDSLMFPKGLHPATSPRTDLMLGDAFNISQSAVLSLSNYMGRTFTRARTAAFNASTPGNPYAIGGYYIGDSSDFEYDPPVMQAFYESDDLGATFSALAGSMSNAMRAHRSSNETATGELGQLVTTYRIAWPWIALPALVVTASIVQLAIIIRVNRGSPVWKSSTLATLSTRGYLEEPLTGATTLHDLRTAASKEHVHLFDRGADRQRGEYEEVAQDGAFGKRSKPGVTATVIEMDDRMSS